MGAPVLVAETPVRVQWATPPAAAGADGAADGAAGGAMLPPGALPPSHAVMGLSKQEQLDYAVVRSSRACLCHLRLTPRIAAHCRANVLAHRRAAAHCAAAGGPHARHLRGHLKRFADAWADAWADVGARIGMTVSGCGLFSAHCRLVSPSGRVGVCALLSRARR